MELKVQDLVNNRIDKYILVVNKQKGLVVHPGNGNPNRNFS